MTASWRAGLAALAARRFLQRRLELAPGVRLVDDGLLDEYLQARVELNEPGRQVVAALVAGETVGATCAALAVGHPAQPVQRDVLRLVAGLNAVGLVNALPRGPVELPVLAWLVAPRLGWLARSAGWLAGRVGDLSITRRAQVGWPAGAWRLLMAVIGCLLPMMLGLWMTAGVLVACGSRLAGQVVVCSGVLLLSVMAHELAHAIALGARRIAYTRSLGGVSVLVADADRHRRWRAAAAGPLAGSACCVLAMVAGAAAGSGLVVAASLAVAASHLLSLAPWAPDGRMLRSSAAREQSDPTRPQEASSS